MTKDSSAWFRSSSAGWARLMDQVATPRLEWPPEELSSMWKHQLAAEIAAESGGIGLEVENDLTSGMIGTGRSQSFPTFGELFQNSQPPVELLQRVKHFAKANRDHPESLLPPEICTLLYYASIVAALVRGGDRISQLDDAALQQGIAWALGRPWLDEKTRLLLTEGLEYLDAKHE